MFHGAFWEVEPFLEDTAPITKTKPFKIFTNNDKKSELKVELTIIVDYIEIFAKATYNFKGSN